MMHEKVTLEDVESSVVGTNKWAKLSTLATLIRIAIGKNVGNLWVYGDSKPILDWLNGNSIL